MRPHLVNILSYEQNMWLVQCLVFFVYLSVNNIPDKPHYNLCQYYHRIFTNFMYTKKTSQKYIDAVNFRSFITKHVSTLLKRWFNRDDIIQA